MSSSNATLTTTAATNLTPPLKDSTIHNNHLTTQQTTLANLFDQATTESIVKITTDTKPTTASKVTTETVVQSTAGGPVENPPVDSTVEPSSYDTPLDNVDMSDDVTVDRNNANVDDLVKKIESVSDRTKVNKNANPVDVTTRINDFSIAMDKENAGSSTISVKTKGPKPDSAPNNENNKGNENSGDISLNIFGNWNDTKSTTPSDVIDTNEKTRATNENPIKADENRSEVPSTVEHETKQHEVTRDTTTPTDGISVSSTSEEERSQSGVPDITGLYHTTQHSTTVNVQSTPKHEPSDPWRTDFSDDFWSKFESTTENWNSSSKPASKTTLATPWTDEVPFSTMEKDFDENSNTVLSSVSVTPPTEGTTVATATNKHSTKKVTMTTKSSSSPLTTEKPESSSAPLATHKQDSSSSVSMETDKRSPVTMTTSIQLTTSTTSTSTVLPPTRNVPTSSEGDFYSGKYK